MCLRWTSSRLHRNPWAILCFSSNPWSKFSEDIWFCFTSYFCVLVTYNVSMSCLGEVLPHQKAVTEGCAQHTMAEAVSPTLGPLSTLRQSPLALEAKEYSQCQAQKWSPLTLPDWSTQCPTSSVFLSIYLPHVFWVGASSQSPWSKHPLIPFVSEI